MAYFYSSLIGLQRSTKVYKGLQKSTMSISRDRDRRPEAKSGEFLPAPMPRPFRTVPAGQLPGARVRPLPEQQIWYARSG
jgi:hypothetical protein